ncbi:WXG100 family type VII secretion target [Microbacterium halimionae]|uniref:WXG100 family type VII secretion target n=1 Tax=Microbacterium halimionae TaxID=1526413 RepID=A0A7W3JLR4_9MICO|nr:WXG100 family type VII secretion target [Microbacterium halimionae]MBA8815029.1 WXG100 family type VII secretion target [Microbacterium halimionae]NII94180.1 WXG100 family type VII secretion target [Microbacterium halimionae]
MSEQISAQEGALVRGAEAVSGAHLDIADSTNRVRSELDQIQAIWSGDAARAYGEMVNTWTAGAARINLTLVRLEEALRLTHRDQSALEENHQTTIGGLGAMMGSE